MVHKVKVNRLLKRKPAIAVSQYQSCPIQVRVHTRHECKGCPGVAEFGTFDVHSDIGHGPVHTDIIQNPHTRHNKNTQHTTETKITSLHQTTHNTRRPAYILMSAECKVFSTQCININVAKYDNLWHVYLQVYILYYFECYQMCYIASIYNVLILTAWPLPIVTLVLIGQPLIMCALHIHDTFPGTTMLILSLYPSYLMLITHKPSTSWDWWLFVCCTSTSLNGHFHTWQHFDCLSDGPANYYCSYNLLSHTCIMVSLLAQSYFSHPEYLVVQY